MLPNSSNYSGLYLSWLLLFLCCPCIFNAFKLPCSYWHRLKFYWHRMWRIAKQWLIYHCWFPRGKGRFSQSNLPNIRARGQKNQETGQLNKENDVEWSMWGATIFSKEGRDYISVSSAHPHACSTGQAEKQCISNVSYLWQYWFISHTQLQNSWS